MCGISGIFAKHILDQHKVIVDEIMHSQFARGPDFQRMQLIQGQKQQVLFAHNRLSIIDLSENAHQPLWDYSHRYCIIYNGEIYNYLELREELIKLGFKFNTNSDTEVILNAFAQWGTDALPRFIGPFAFALYDTQTDNLWLCRDRFGVRPLYFCVQHNILYFASSTPILAKRLNLTPNLNYVARGLKYLVFEDGSEETAYTGLFSLKPGNYLKATILNTKLTYAIHTYYHLSQQVSELIENLATANQLTLLNTLETQLHQAVNIRLRSDVPLAISLSSGLDSSSIAALVSQQHANTIGFSFGHPNHALTEGPLVAHCAKFLDIQMEYISPTSQEMIAGLFNTLKLQDAPFSSLSVVAQALLFERVNAKGVKVLLGGQGGDEAFMGYRKFFIFYLQQLIKQKKYWASSKNLFAMLPMFLAELPKFPMYWQQRRRFKNNSHGMPSVLNLPEATLNLVASPNQPLWNRQLQDIMQFSLPTLLRYEDKNGSGNSVESRLPFLDHRLIELGLALPTALKLRAGFGKWSLREIMQNKIPQKIRLARYKRGFDISLVHLIKAGLGKAIRDTLHNQQYLLKEMCHSKFSVLETYSDDQLIHRQNAMAEVIALLWLGSVAA